MKKGQILPGRFSKTGHKTWWNCEFVSLENGIYTVKTEKGIKTFTAAQYNPTAQQRIYA